MCAARTGALGTPNTTRVGSLGPDHRSGSIAAVNRHVLRAFAAAVAVVLALGLAACSSDDGADVRSVGTPGRARVGSSSGLRLRPVRRPTSPAPATTRSCSRRSTDYKAYVNGEIDQLVDDTKVFTDAVRAGDVEAAKAAFAPSRVPLGAHRADRRPGRGRSTARSTPGSTTSRTRTTRRSPAGTGSSTSSGRRTRPTARPSSPTSSTRTWPR